MSAIPDFTDAQIASVQSLLTDRYGDAVEIHSADSDIKIQDSDSSETSCPVLFWSAKDCNFAIIRTEADKFRARYFYTPDEQHPTAQIEFNTIEDCTTAVLRAQADHQRQMDIAADPILNPELN